jgi:hypothetical protein
VVGGAVRPALAVAAIALAGCNQILGIDDFVTGDAGSVEVDAAPEPDANPTTVTGTSIVSHIRFDGTVENAPEDLSAYTIKAYVPNGDGTFTIVDGTGHEDGTFEIPDVPVGATYYLMLGYPPIPNQPDRRPVLWVTDDRTLDLGYHVMGRADGVEAVQASPVILNLTGMSAWGEDDAIYVDSYNNGSEFGNLSVVTNAPAPGATALSGFRFDWRDGYTYHPVGSLPRLLDAAEGDDLYVAHFHHEDALSGRTTYRVGTLRGVFHTSDLTQTDGVPLTVDGAFTPVTLDQTATVTFNVEQFRSRYPDSARAFDEGFSILTIDNAGTDYQQAIGIGPWGVDIGFPLGRMRSEPSTFTLPGIAYGEPDAYPTAWGRVASVTYRSWRRLRPPGATNNAYSVLAINGYLPVGSTLNVTPGLRPPQEIVVDGGVVSSEPGVVGFDGVNGVEVDWDDVADADGYAVNIEHMYFDAGTIKNDHIFHIFTSESSVTLPADLLTQGERYHIIVYSYIGLDEIGLRRYQSPAWSAATASGLMLFSSECGDGEPDTALGEECDTGTASATCDGDCSLPLCGDGFMNPLANETCDHVVDTYGCDGDCTAVACGDGRWNQAAEDCDDGNTTVEPNGCSSTCTRIGFCGDGTIQTWFETCEPANTPTCDMNCNPI